jgi:hypothetical protein
MYHNQYLVIENVNLEKFTAEVNKHLIENWQLHGNLIALLDPDAYGTDHAIIYIQAVKKV